MPGLLTRRSSLTFTPESAETTTVLSFSGFIDAANYTLFERSLEEAYAAGGRFVILDFHDVLYINSTGISVIIRYFELYNQRGGLLCLAGVTKDVGLSMHLLGVTSFIPFLKDVPAARAHLRSMVESAGAASTSEARVSVPEPSLATRQVVRFRRRPGGPSGRVLVIAPNEGRFTRVMRRRFEALNGDYHLLHGTEEALKRFVDIAPDVVVIDNRCDESGRFVERLKMDRKSSLSSIVKLYAKHIDVHAELDFKIWENDYLVEPFEVLELFTLAEAELVRLPKDRKVLSHQMHFEFRTTQHNLERACKLADVALRQSVTHEDDATALFAAVKEGIDNAARHGNRLDPKKTIDVNLLVDKKKLTVIIEDQGNGFDYEYYVSRLDDEETFDRARKRIQEENARGGLGILLMYKCTDRLEYSGAGNVLRLEKNL